MRSVEYGAQNHDTVILLHGGGLSWWNYREAARLLQEDYHVIAPILDGHVGSDAPFSSIEENAARIIAFIDEHYSGKVLALGGLSLGGQIVVEILSQRSDICKFALIESALVEPMKLTHALIAPAISISYALIRQKWFAKLQAAYLGIPKVFFEDYYRDTCNITKEDMIAFLESNSAYSLKPGITETKTKAKIIVGSKEQLSVRRSGNLLNRLIPDSTIEILHGYRHGDLSLNHPEQYAMLLKERLYSQKADATHL